MERRRKAFEHAIRTRIHIEKMDDLGEELVKMGLATGVRYPWYEVESQTADDYMTYLAAALGRLPELHSAPVTDEIACLRSLTSREDSNNLVDRELAVLRMEILEAALPAPAAPLSAAEISIFKKRHGAELSNFRLQIELDLTDIASIDNPYLRQKRLELVRERVSAETQEICSRMQSRGWHDIIFGKLCAVLSEFPVIGLLPKLANAVYKAVADSQPFDKSVPLAYAASAQVELLGPG